MARRSTGLFVFGAFIMGWATLAFAVGDDNSSIGNDPDFEQARALVDAERWADALPILLRIEVDLKSSAEVYNLLGVTYRKLKDYPTSKRHYDRALEIDPRHLPTLEYQGEWYLETGDVDGALRNLARLKDLCGDCHEYQHLAEALKKAGVAR